MRRVPSWCAVLVAAAVVGAGSPAEAVPVPEPTQVVAMIIADLPPVPAGHAVGVGGAITASGHGLAGATVHLMVETYGSTTFSDAGAAVSDANGRFGLTSPVLWQNAKFRLDYAGDATHDPSTSSVWDVPVSAVATIHLSDRTPRVGHRVVVTGQTSPNRAGRRIAVWTGTRPCWCYVRPDYSGRTRLARGVVRDDGSYRLVIRFSSAGRKRIYALVGGGGGNLAGTSRYRHLRVG